MATTFSCNFSVKSDNEYLSGVTFFPYSQAKTATSGTSEPAYSGANGTYMWGISNLSSFVSQLYSDSWTTDCSDFAVSLSSSNFSSLINNITMLYPTTITVQKAKIIVPTTSSDGTDGTGNATVSADVTVTVANAAASSVATIDRTVTATNTVDAVTQAKINKEAARIVQQDIEQFRFYLQLYRQLVQSGTAVWVTFSKTTA